MKTQFFFHLEVLAILLLSVIPWPGPSVFKISCPRDRANVVRRIVHKRWMPILKKYQVELPLECPFHESRDIFRPQQRAKHQHRPSQWTCGLCGKSFYTEKHLDAHFDNRHKSNVNTAEDAVCLADYCDIMRCDVLATRDFENSLLVDDDEESGHLNTDIQVWQEITERQNQQLERQSWKEKHQGHERQQTGTRTIKGGRKISTTINQRTISTPCKTKELSRNSRDKLCGKTNGGSVISNIRKYCYRVGSTDIGGRNSESGDPKTGASDLLDNHRLAGLAYNHESANKNDPCGNGCDGDEDEEYDEEGEEEEEEEEEEEDEDDEENMVESAFPAVDKKQRRRGLHLRKLKSNCRPEELNKLKLQCEILVRDCIAGLLTNLSVRDFQDIEGELNRAICWYLSCDRYWEDSKRQQRRTSWYLLVSLLMILLTSIYACYYIIWVIFSTGDEEKIAMRRYHGHSNIPTKSPMRDPVDGRLMIDRRKIDPNEEHLSPNEDMPDHYIYVAYPPELKRRLLESSCLSRNHMKDSRLH